MIVAPVPQMDARARQMLARPMSKSPRMMAAAAASAHSHTSEMANNQPQYVIQMPMAAPQPQLLPPQLSAKATTKDAVKAIVKATEMQLALKKLRAHKE
jgi:hypothetical protein